jgi:hypothetical protein
MTNPVRQLVAAMERVERIAAEELRQLPGLCPRALEIRTALHRSGEFKKALLDSRFGLSDWQP